jgi:hypothetical protein
MRIRADLFEHVEAPDHVGIRLRRQLLIGRRTIVLLVAESLDVDTQDNAPVAHVVQALALDSGRGRDALERPVVGATRFELGVRVLPQELAIRFTERHEHTAVTRLLGIAHELVVGAHEHHSTCDHWVAVAL